MGVLEEEDITRALSRKFNIPAVDLEQIMHVAPEAIAAVPAELAEKYRVLPLEFEGRRLTLAMAFEILVLKNKILSL
jgi:type IV pilus assembly protein PilB